jgi:preprotein translocase subunit SecF
MTSNDDLRGVDLGGVDTAGVDLGGDDLGGLTTAVSAETDPRQATSDKQYGRQAGFISKLTTGTGAFNILGHRKVYYIVSGTLVVASILLIIFRGFQFGIDFAGGTTLQFQPNDGQSVSTSEVAQVVTSATGIEPDAVQTVGTQVQVSSSTLTVDQVVAAKGALNQTYAPSGGVSDSAVSETWGSQISQRALLAVIVFLVAVAGFLWVRYEKRMAAGAVVSVLHDVIITAGIYSLVGFEVTPSTVIGLLTILGFSLYDTVVVYDKVQENTKGLTSLNRRTYPEAANLAVNQTLMRSINTSLIALLPVAGLLVAGVVILGSGTLKDLSLVMLIGMLVGAYSSVFIAVPIAVDLKLRDPLIKAHTQRVTAKRKAEGLIVDADGDPIRRISSAANGSTPAAARVPVAPSNLTPGVAPKPGVKPVRRPAKPAPTGGAGTPAPTAKVGTPAPAPAPAPATATATATATTVARLASSAAPRP